MEWSHELLSDEERTLFRRLSVFAGGFTLEAAESVCAGEELGRNEVLQLLSHLVDKSLVLMTEQDGAARYRLLETVRQHGREKLSESGEAGRFRDEHAGYYLALAEEAEPELKGELQIAWLERFEREHGNLRAAISWSLEQCNLQDAADSVGRCGCSGGYTVTSPRDGSGWRRCYRRRVTPPCRRMLGRNPCSSRVRWHAARVITGRPNRCSKKV
jgi:predicted ATPase